MCKYAQPILKLNQIVRGRGSKNVLWRGRRGGNGLDCGGNIERGGNETMIHNCEVGEKMCFAEVGRKAARLNCGVDGKRRMFLRIDAGGGREGGGSKRAVRLECEGNEERRQ